MAHSLPVSYVLLINKYIVSVSSDSRGAGLAGFCCKKMLVENNDYSAELVRDSINVWAEVWKTLY